MTLISGVFFPTNQLPGWLAMIGGWLPLAQGVALEDVKAGRVVSADEVRRRIFYFLDSLIVINLYFCHYIILLYAADCTFYTCFRFRKPRTRD